MAGEPKNHISNALRGMDKETSYSATNLDSSPQFNPHDYSHAENMRVISANPSRDGGRSPATGNQLAFDLGEVTESNKQIRAYYDFNNGDSINTEVSVTYSGGTWTTGSVALGVTTLDGYDTWLQGQLDGAGIGTFTYIHDSGVDYTDITMEAEEWDITIRINISPSSVTSIQQTITLTEYIPAELTGFLQPIGSKEINGDEFFFSTTLSEDGVGEIGVCTFNGLGYTYTRLLRSKNLKYGWFHLIDVDGERVGDRVTLYYCDDYNVYRSFYYNGAYIEDGALNVNDPLNFYELDSVEAQSMLQPQAPYTAITLSSQTQTGGGLISGNIRYCVKYVTPFGSETEPTPLSNVFEVFPPSLSGTATLLAGSADGTKTTKINVLNLTGVDTDVFPKVKLIAVQYYDTTATISEIGTFDTSINNYQISHTGNEIAASLTVADVQDVEAQVLNGLNVRIVDTRLVRSNYETRPDYDFTAFAQALTLTTTILELDSEGAYINASGVGMTADGYFQPSNLNLYAGYMDNETYRFGVRVKWLNGGYSQVYWIADKLIDPNDTTADVSLTTDNASDSKLRVRYLELGNIAAALALLPVGVDVNDIECFEVVRAECVPEIIGSGVITCDYNRSIGGINYAVPYQYDARGGTARYDSDDGIASPLSYFQNFIAPNLILGNSQIEFQVGDQFKYQDGIPEIDFDAGSYMNTQSQASPLEQVNGYSNVSAYTTIDVENVIFTESNLNDPVAGTFGDYTVSDSKVVFTHSVLGSVTYEANFLTLAEQYAVGIPTDKNYWNMLGVYTPMVSFGAELFNYNNTSLQPLIGQYYRPITNKYGNPDQTTYIPTGAFFTANDTTCDVFGGDTVIEKSCFKLGVNDLSGGNTTDGNPMNVVGGFTFFSQNRIHAQMRNGSGGTGAYTYPFQLPSSGTWANKVGAWMEQNSQEAISYSASYTIVNNENAFAPYDDSISHSNDYAARIDWSDSKPIGSLIDYYTVFRPLNYRDLDLKYGEIIHMDTANSELVTWQNYLRFMRQYFNNTATLEVLDTATVSTGNGEVMGRRGTEISNIGATHKWGVSKGRSKGGNDVFTWWNQRLGLYARFGYDGTVVLSDEANFRRELINSTRAVDGYDRDTVDWGTPVCSVWDDQYKEFLITFRCWRTELPWADDVTYNAGEVVSRGTTSDYYGLPLFWKAKIANLDEDPLTDLGVYWQQVPLTDGKYYSFYTLAFSEVTNRFSTYYSKTVPKLYHKWQNSYFTACPLNYTNSQAKLRWSKVYSHLEGEICEWWEGSTYNITSDIDFISSDFRQITLLVPLPYMDGLPEQTWAWIVKYSDRPDEVRYNVVSYSGDVVTLEYPMEDVSYVYIRIAPAFISQPYIEYLLNPNPSASKRYHAIKVNSDTEPLEAWFYTDTQESFLKNYYPATTSTPAAITVTALSGGNTILTSAGIQKKMGGFPVRQWHVRVEDPPTVFTDYDVLGFPTPNQVTISGALSPPVTSYSIYYDILSYSDFLYEQYLWTGNVRNDTTGQSVNTGYADRLRWKWLKMKLVFNTFIPTAVYDVISRYREQLRNYI